jgi:hypothetical protein
LCCTSLVAQDHEQANTPNSGFVKRATAILGLEGISSNATVDLSIQNDVLLFQPSHGDTVRIPIGAIQDVFISQEDKEVGGKPLAAARAATPYGGGRAIGLIAHKKYDFLTVEYLDSNGGLHGVICQLTEGQGQAVGDELKAKGVRVTGLTNQIHETEQSGGQE